jgi:2-polyprenyl-3-methyl-5-hydroxy-6-metoxy-1,4-benzoquinol methylase
MGDPVIRSFTAKFENINSKQAGVSDYPGRYLDHILSHLAYYSSIYKYVIDIALQVTKKPVGELSVLDFGAGNGLLGMFARHYGFKKVWMNDMDGGFLQAAERIAGITNTRIDGFIQGDEKKVFEYFRLENTKPDILLSTDVIEHIYDPASFFNTLKALNPDLVHVFSTASNPYNYSKLKKLRKLQYQDEYLGHSAHATQLCFHNAGPALSFLRQRENIITKNFPGLTSVVVSELAKRTRGKRRQDIIDAVKNYMLTNEMPEAYQDPYWVCDPETGSWTERVLPVSMYEEWYKKNGFSFALFNGYYDAWSRTGPGSLAARIMNAVVCKNRLIGKYFSPFIVFQGKPVL